MRRCIDCDGLGFVWVKAHRYYNKGTKIVVDVVEFRVGCDCARGRAWIRNKDKNK